MQSLRARLSASLRQAAKHEIKLQLQSPNRLSDYHQALSQTGRGFHTAIDSMEALPENMPRYLKTKKLTKTAAHIMQILDKEDVEEAKTQRPLPVLRPGDVVRLRVETPENKRRVSAFRGIVMAIRRHGLQSTFRIRRFVAGVGVELLFPLYSPNIKELKVLEHRKVRRNKLYYLRDKMQDKQNKIT